VALFTIAVSGERDLDVPVNKFRSWSYPPFNIRAAPMAPRTATPKQALPVSMNPKQTTSELLSGEKGTGSDDSPVETDSPEEPEFKEGGYGW
jgi:hypothetical protein